MGKKKSKGKNKKGAYTPIGEELSVDQALIQAANLLDDASVGAKKTDNIEQMAVLSGYWSDLAVKMTAIYLDTRTDLEHNGSESRTQQVIGFAPPSVREDDDEEYGRE